MRNALILTGVWLGILVTAYAIVFWDQGIDRPLPISLLEEEVRTSAAEYVHPDGLFSLRVPMGWRMEDDVDYVQLVDPNDNVSVWVLAVDEGDLTASVNSAVAILGLDSTFEPMVGGESSDSWAGESGIIQSVSFEDELHFNTHFEDTLTVVMISVGMPKALEALSDNLEWIWSELSVPAEDLLLI
ncbi:hypothetical protein ACFLSG_03170 [Candidatus Bipolaricaulota bacterium]